MPAQKYTSKALFDSNVGVFIYFPKILQLGKFEGADFKCDNNVFKFQPKNIQIRHYSIQI